MKISDVPEDCGDKNIFEIGLIDSLGVILLIEDIETHFEIRFDEIDFQDRRFPTINGLSEIIKERKGG